MLRIVGIAATVLLGWVTAASAGVCSGSSLGKQDGGPWTEVWLRDAVPKADSDSDGYLTMDDLKSLIRRYNELQVDKAVETLLTRYDADGDDAISWNELGEYWNDTASTPDGKTIWISLYGLREYAKSIFDWTSSRDGGNGRSLSEPQLRSFLDGTAKDGQARETNFKLSDPNGDGKQTFEEAYQYGVDGFNSNDVDKDGYLTAEEFIFELQKANAFPIFALAGTEDPSAVNLPRDFVLQNFGANPFG